MFEPKQKAHLLIERWGNERDTQKERDPPVSQAIDSKQVIADV